MSGNARVAVATIAIGVLMSTAVSNNESVLEMSVETKMRTDRQGIGSTTFQRWKCRIRYITHSQIERLCGGVEAEASSQVCGMVRFIGSRSACGKRIQTFVLTMPVDVPRLHMKRKNCFQRGRKLQKAHS